MFLFFQKNNLFFFIFIFCVFYSPASHPSGNILIVFVLRSNEIALFQKGIRMKICSFSEFHVYP